MKFGVVSRKRRCKGAANCLRGVVIQGFSCINMLLLLFLHGVFRVVSFFLSFIINLLAIHEEESDKIIWV